MKIGPVIEAQSPEAIKVNYQRLKDSLKSDSLPIFFTFIGAFPEYLEYITEQLVRNLSDDRFQKLIDDTVFHILPLIDSLEKSEQTEGWLAKYRNSPAFFYFQKDLKNIFELNAKLAFVFIALREAIKGWAIAAKKLPEASSPHHTEEAIFAEEQFIYDNSFVKITSEVAARVSTSSQQFITKSSDLPVKYESSSLESNLLPQYLELCRIDFEKHLATERSLYLRLGIEKIILNSLPLFPNLVISPINEVIDLTKKYDNFPDLLYLLSEHFPTYSAQRLMFSGFMMER